MALGLTWRNCGRVETGMPRRAGNLRGDSVVDRGQLAKGTSHPRYD